MKYFFKWTEGSIFKYTTSIASSWIWAPAIFISSQQAYANGLAGFLMFFLPNFFTLMLFGYVASYVRQRIEGYTVMDALKSSPVYQQYTHSFFWLYQYLLLLQPDQSHRLSLSRMTGVSQMQLQLQSSSFYNLI